MVLTGTHTPIADRLRLDLRLDDARTGATLARYTNLGARDDLFEFVSGAGSNLRGALGIGASPADRRAANYPPRIDPDALRAWSEGVEKYRKGDMVEASARLGDAVRKAPRFAPAHEALASAWKALGFDLRARVETKMALDSSGDLPRHQRLQIEANYYESTANWPRAIETWTALQRFYPEDSEYTERLALAQTSGGRPAAALETIHAAQMQHPPTVRGLHFALAEASADEAIADWKANARAAGEALLLARQIGSRFFEERALIEEANALHHLGNDTRALADLDAAESGGTAAHDEAGVAPALLVKGEVLEGHDRADSAKALQQALEIDRRIGYRRSAAHVIEALAQLRRVQADMKGAQTLLTESLGIMRELGDGPGEVTVQISLGNIALNTGDQKMARRIYSEALVRAREISDRHGIAVATGNLAQIDLVEGDLPASRSHLEEALRLKRELGDRNSLAYTLGKLAEVSFASGNLVLARTYADEQRTVLREANLWGPRDQIIYAQLAIEEGQPAEAEPWMSTLGAQSPKPNPGAEAYRVLALSWLARADTKKAREAVEEALRRARMSPNRPDYGIPADLMAARVEAAEGRVPNALHHMKQLLVEARRLGNVELELEIRASQGELDKKASGDGRVANSELAEVAADATARGFGLVAEHARKAMRGVETSQLR